MITSWILVVTIATLVCDSNLHTAMAHNWMCHTCATLPLGQLSKSALRRNKVDQDWIKWWLTTKVYRATRGPLNIVRGIILTLTSISPAVRESSVTSRVITYNLRAMYSLGVDICGVVLCEIWRDYSIMVLMKFAYLSQSDRSNWVMSVVKDPCTQPGWDGYLSLEKIS